MESREVDSVSRPLAELARCLDSHPGFADAVAALRAGQPATFDGVVGGSCALLAANLLAHAPGHLVIVSRSEETADFLDDDLRMFLPGVPTRFPAWESDAAEQTLHAEIFGERLRTLKRLQLGTPSATEPFPALDRVVLASFHSLMQGVPAPRQMRAHTRCLRTGDTVDGEALREWLVTNRYHATSAVQLPGEFAVRGGILDLFAADWDYPVRLEWFGDQIESIRRFDLSSQRSVESLEQVEITVLHPEAGLDASFAEHAPPGTWVLWNELEQSLAEAERYHARLESQQGIQSPQEVLRSLASLPNAMAAAVASGVAAQACRLQLETVQRFSGDVAKVREELDQSGDDARVFLIAKTDAERQRLSEIFADTKLARTNRLHLLVGTLCEGFRLVPERLVLLSAAELFQRGELRRVPRRKLGKAIDSFLDLREGDLVVHLTHGIGRYRGLRQIDKHGRSEEHLQIEFHGGTKVYVPAQRIGLVQKYVGGVKSRPALARIGSKSWVRQKAAAEAAVVDLAAEMLEVQAARQSRPGIAFAVDSPWQQEFDTSFPYTETNDQLTAIESIKRDMLAPRPMDRLLCGDVGFGKTEVAMRAAFKAVDSGFQVAVLVPTTILAEQHFHTFRNRMAEFPFDIARLSRFCSPREQRQIIDGLAAGRIDIVIGTHRLASADIQLYNLGLVIIDEEQRFGVEVKERLKQLRSTVDVLTMTATPIPRTLHMSLVGVRDISNLETPPEDRLAVETRVTRFDPGLIRHAVLRELNRGGQIYFVHNRVQDIEKLAHRLRYIVPEATIRIAHGQMPETDLEQVMVDFVNHKFDLLLATTIVESGLDIPNANTIFIDEANRYGLADLHQLRGRVGRYKHHAYCYLLVDPGVSLTPNAARRLRAIEEFSDMGAGFAIAMRDLEIRGAGNLLGTQQSGHIAAIGYEMYCQLLESAVRRLQQLPPIVSLDVHINLPGEALFPSDYVTDIRTKIDLYRRLVRIADVRQIDEFRQELFDRFGPPPPPVVRLLELALLRIDAAIWQVSVIHIEEIYLVFRYENAARIAQLARLSGNRLRIVDGQNAYLTAGEAVNDAHRILELAKSVLRCGG
jgi:transcription-repair coupling factor (superfamily II helicase)